MPPRSQRLRPKGETKRLKELNASIFASECAPAESDPYHLSDAPCKRSDHVRKANCASNPNCHFALGEKSGIWQSPPAPLKALAINPVDFIRHNTSTPCGLENLGATCYMNALLQALYFNVPFRDFILSLRPSDAWDPQGVIRGMQVIFCHLAVGTEKYYSPKQFIEILSLKSGMQQDAQEFNKLLLTLLEGNLSHAPLSQALSQARDFIPKMFSGLSEYRTLCTRCGYISQRPNRFYELVRDIADSPSSISRCSVYQELHLRGCSSIHDSLSELFREESLTGDDR